MVQIVCPNCDAKYNVPDAALGAKGRKVSCAKCKTAWHATAPEDEVMVLSEPTGTDPAEAQAAAPKPVISEDEKRRERARQLAEIKQIVDEVQGGGSEAPPVDPVKVPPTAAIPPAEDGPGRDTIRKRESGSDSAFRSDLPGGPSGRGTEPEIPFPEPDAAPVAPKVERPEAPEEKAKSPSLLKALTGGAGRKAKVETTPPAKPEPPQAPPPEPAREVEERDPLRDRIANRSERPPSTEDVEKSRKKMMRKHNRRYSRRMASEKRSTGAFTTGLLLVLIVVALLAALYLLAPQISAQVPSAGPVLENYIAKVDEARAGLGGLVQNFIDKVAPLFTGKEGA